ncbi:subclass B3 metallo-beta-lactamase [Lysobacter soli]|uniref:subclass B3 metallo-beta-lactamase n=1 Tax=Lysobacter soli TaxID=453783 RepID=UPI00240FFAFF|nr:subclass B3 metallo-beta-lactamase [Lysobacter soli]MDG2518376.1 subclass B3 metallo-beta-lactamase [Lysobacter soli]
MSIRIGLSVVLFAGLSAATAQEMPRGTPTKEQLASDKRMFITLANKALKWDEPADPIRIVGPLYFVGAQGLSSWLFATPAGHILLNTGTPKSGPMIADSIRKLGFKPEDIRILINGHGHSDHAGAFAYFKKLSGAQLAVMQEDVAMIEDGGKSDFHYGRDWKVMGQPPVKVDRVLRDGDTVRLGEVMLTAYHTPGHTRGATTWVTTLVQDGQAYEVVFPDGAGFNPGYRVAQPPEYPGIEHDYRTTLHRLEMLEPDIWLGHHTEYFDLIGKRQRAASQGVQAWVDPEGYRQFVAGKRRAFEDEVDAEKDVPFKQK